jgi:hypothetical protein
MYVQSVSLYHHPINRVLIISIPYKSCVLAFFHIGRSKTEEPDFFELEKSSPLPTLEEARITLETRKMNRLRDHFEKDTIVRSVPSHHQFRSAAAAAVSAIASGKPSEADRAHKVNARRQALMRAELLGEGQSGGAEDLNSISNDGRTDEELQVPAPPIDNKGKVDVRAKNEELQLQKCRHVGRQQRFHEPEALGYRPEQGFLGHYNHAPMHFPPDVLEQERYQRMRDAEYMREEHLAFHRQMNMMHAPQHQHTEMGYERSFQHMGSSGMNPYFGPP